ncbi:hypothetical protein D3C76_1444600 [compost metagenome]
MHDLHRPKNPLTVKAPGIVVAHFDRLMLAFGAASRDDAATAFSAVQYHFNLKRNIRPRVKYFASAYIYNGRHF